MARAKRIEGETDNTMSDKDSRKIAQIGGNIGPVKESLAKKISEYKENKKQIKALNEANSLLREEAEVLGVNKKAFQRAVTDTDQDTEALEAMDESYALCRESVGRPIGAQPDMFEAASA
jgi:hypothetical protein